MFLPLVVMHPEFNEESWRNSELQNSPYRSFRHIFENYHESLKLIEAGVAYYKSIKNCACEERSEHGDWSLQLAVIHDIVATSAAPVTEDEIVERYEKRYPAALLGSRWSQLAEMIGTEEIYLCLHKIGLEGIMIEGIDFLKTLLGGDDAEFEDLKKVCSRNGWVKELCLGLRGVVASIKMLEVSGDEEDRDKLACQIQKQVGKVFGVVDDEDFHLGAELALDKMSFMEATTIVEDSM
jgi:hypothetical protein